MTRILVIDDEAHIRAILSDVLEIEGYEVAGAANGLTAMRQFREKPFDLVITDMIMPEKEGLETMREIRKEFPDTKIIAISGGGLVGPESYLALAKSFGAERTFTKPFDLKTIVTAVEELVGR